MKVGKLKSPFARRMVVPVLAAGVLVGAGAWEFARPASAAIAAPAPAPPDENNALLALDQAMESLAARVTPAVVNVTVTSKQGPQEFAEDDNDQGQQGQQQQQQMQQFFGPGSPFGQFFQGPMQ